MEASSQLINILLKNIFPNQKFMKIYDGKNIKYRDGLAEKRRRVWILKTLFFVGLVIAVIGLVAYLLFFSGFLEIQELSVNGLDKVNSDRFNNELNKRLDSKWLGLVEYQRNVLFFDSDAFKTEILATFPEIKELSVSKKLLHALNVDVTEREMAGIWCFVDGSTTLTTSCRYFDREGHAWGKAARSSGFLILVVEDMRPDVQQMVQQDSPQLDRELITSMILILEQLKELDVFINKFTIPDNYIGDFNAFTSSGYELLFSIDSNISKQLEVLEIFLAEKQGDPSFQPQYIDLRINGRVYYK